MDEKQLIALMCAFGEKFYELQSGFAALFNLCEARGVFSREQFLGELSRVQAFPDLKSFRDLLDRLRMSTEGADLQDLLRKFEGRVQ
jgi:hypothetical protein